VDRARRSEDSGVFAAPESESTEPIRFEPEVAVIGVAWALAVVQIAFGIANHAEFGPDRAIAVAFAVGCPVLARSRLSAFSNRIAARARGLFRPIRY